MKLQFAHLTYGNRNYSVVPNETLPLPVEFDFSNPEECARKIFAIMSNASGGHRLRSCKMAINQEKKTANLTANGAHVFYDDPSRPKVSIKTQAEAEAFVLDLARTRKVVLLGSVRTDQYGDGWKRAVWTEDTTDQSGL